MTKPHKGWKDRTNLVHAGSRRSHYGELSEALFLTQSYVYENAEAAEERFKANSDNSCGDEFIYTRYGNPTTAMFEDRMAALESAEAAFATDSGMSAVTAALMCQLRAGDHVVASRALFGSCMYVINDLLPRFAVTSTLVDGTDLDAWKSAVTDRTKVFFLETPSNPCLEILDISAIAEISHKIGAKLIVDNVFATPVFQRPLALGADIVVYSATKYIDGHGRCLGGLVLADNKFINDELKPFLQHSGGAISPFNSWVMLKSLENLDYRCRAQASSATEIAESLLGHHKVARVIYPGLKNHPQYELASRQMQCGGPLLSIELKGGKEEAFRFLNTLRLLLISNNLGDAKSLAVHPATTTHQSLSEEMREQLGITPALIRISCGLEDVSDLKEDILQALDQI